MVDGRWDASDDGRSPWAESGGQPDAGSQSGPTAKGAPAVPSPFASSSPFADSPFVRTDEAAMWLDDEAGSSPVSTTAPVMWLWLACASAVGGLLLAILTDLISWHLVGWVLAGPLALGLLALFTLKDTARRANPWYVVDQVAPWLYRIAIVAALVGVIACALRIALYVGRL